MNPDLTIYLVGLACFGIGVFGSDMLIHRPDRRLRAAVHAAEVERMEQVADALMSDVVWARTELAKRDLELDAANVRRLTLLRGVR